MSWFPPFRSLRSAVCISHSQHSPLQTIRISRKDRRLTDRTAARHRSQFRCLGPWDGPHGASGSQPQSLRLGLNGLESQLTIPDLTSCSCSGAAARTACASCRPVCSPCTGPFCASGLAGAWFAPASGRCVRPLFPTSPLLWGPPVFARQPSLPEGGLPGPACVTCVTQSLQSPPRQLCLVSLAGRFSTALIPTRACNVTVFSSL